MRETGSGNRNVTSSDSQSLVIIDGSHKPKNIVIVIKRLANPHNHNMADALTLSALVKIFLHQHNLRHNFPIIQITLLFNQPASTKCTANIAANLSSYTDRQTIVLTHENCFNQHTVWQFKKILYCAVSRFLHHSLL